MPRYNLCSSPELGRINNYNSFMKVFRREPSRSLGDIISEGKCHDREGMFHGSIRRYCISDGTQNAATVPVCIGWAEKMNTDGPTNNQTLCHVSLIGGNCTLNCIQKATSNQCSSQNSWITQT